MNYLNNGQCTPTSCRYCCTPYLNGHFCGTESDCGACLNTTAATIVIAIICSLLFLALLAWIIYRLCLRRSEIRAFGAVSSPSVIVQPVSGQLIGSQYGSMSGSGVIYGTRATGLGMNAGTVSFSGSGVNYGALGSAAAEAQAAVYGSPIRTGTQYNLSGSGVFYQNGNIGTGIVNPVGGLQTNIAMNNNIVEYNNGTIGNQYGIGAVPNVGTIVNTVGFGQNPLSISGVGISGGALSQNLICNPPIISPNIIQGSGSGVQNMNMGLINQGVFGTGVHTGISTSCNQIGGLGVQNGYINSVNTNLVGSPSSFSFSNNANCANHLAGTHNLGSERTLLGYPNSRTSNNC